MLSVSVFVCRHSRDSSSPPFLSPTPHFQFFLFFYWEKGLAPFFLKRGGARASTTPPPLVLYLRTSVGGGSFFFCHQKKECTPRHLLRRPPLPPEVLYITIIIKLPLRRTTRCTNGSEFSRGAAFCCSSGRSVVRRQ